MCGFIAQLVEHRAGIAEVAGSNPAEALIFTAMIILYFHLQLQFKYELFHIYLTSKLFCLHYSTGTHNTTMFIYGRVGQPSHRAVYLTYMQMCINIKYYINKRTEAPKPDTKTPKKQQVEKTRGTCTPDQCSGATLGVLGYASA